MPDEHGPDLEPGEPATMVFTWQVKRGREADFKRWLHGITKASSAMPGALGTTILRPKKPGGLYHIILRFDDSRHLADWLNSEEREAWLRGVQGIATQRSEQATGMETWFSLPGTSVVPPPRWKMVIMTFVAVYPLSLILNLTAIPHLTWLPVGLRALVFPLVLPPTLTYVLMPLLSRMFRRWLYPGRH